MRRSLRLRSDALARRIKNAVGPADLLFMRPVVALILGVALAGLAGSVLWEGVPDRPLAAVGIARDMGRELLLRESVTVIFVPGREGVAAVRRQTDRSRIVAETRGAFAVDPGRIVAADHRSANEIIARAGWADREIRIAPSAAPVIEQPEEKPILGTAEITWALWAAVVLGLWVASRALAAISLEVRDFFRERRRRLPPLPETVLVLRVDSSDDVASIRAGLPEDRVLADSPQGLALSGGWIVTSGESAASDLAREVGWRDCVLEPFAPDPFGSASRRCDSIAARTGLELADFEEKIVWSPEDALAILLCDTDWRRSPHQY